MGISAYVIATTDPLKYAPNWGNDGFSILRNNPEVWTFSYTKPGCEHAGCRVYLFVTEKLPRGSTIDAECEAKDEQQILRILRKFVERQPYCSEDFKDFIILVNIIEVE